MKGSRGVKNRFVFFDLGNVLVHFDHQQAVDQLAALSGCSRDQVRAAVFESDLQNQYECGLVDCSTFARQINQALDVDLPQAEVLEAISAIFHLNESILPALQCVSQAGVSLGLLSNTCAAHWAWIAKQGWPLPGRWFQFHILSYEVRAMKPADSIYHLCEQRSGRSPRELFFIDDRLENILAAERRGWEVHHYQSTPPLLEHLEAWLG